MAIVTKELYQYSIAQVEENIIKKQELGFAIDTCSIMKLMYSHILVHCVENVDIFNEKQLASINNLVNQFV